MSRGCTYALMSKLIRFVLDQDGLQRCCSVCRSLSALLLWQYGILNASSEQVKLTHATVISSAPVEHYVPL